MKECKKEAASGSLPFAEEIRSTPKVDAYAPP